MGRAIIRTAELNLDTAKAILNLFGTFTNAMSKLGLHGLISYPEFGRALRFMTIKPEEKVLIETAWDRWNELFVQDRVPTAVRTSFNIEPAWHDDEPAWNVAPKRKGGGK